MFDTDKIKVRVRPIPQPLILQYDPENRIILFLDSIEDRRARKTTEEFLSKPRSIAKILWLVVPLGSEFSNASSVDREVLPRCIQIAKQIEAEFINIRTPEDLGDLIDRISKHKYFLGGIYQPKYEEVLSQLFNILIKKAPFEYHVIRTI